MSDDFESYQRDTHPPGHRGTWGQRWGAALGRQKDTTVTRARDAVLAGFPGRAPLDALDLHLADAALERLPGETTASIRARVRQAWDFWPTAGRLAGLTVALTLLGFPTIEVRTAAQLGVTPWAQWFAFTFGYGFSSRPWGAPDTWGTGTWGSDASRDDARRMRRFLRSVSNARDIGWLVLGSTDPSVWGAGGTWGSPAVWGGATTRWRI